MFSREKFLVSGWNAADAEIEIDTELKETERLSETASVFFRAKTHTELMEIKRSDYLRQPQSSFVLRPTLS